MPAVLARQGLSAAAWAGLGLGAALAGAAVAALGTPALYLIASLGGCALILRDFRAGVVLLIVLMPLSRSLYFPHAMFGVTGLNPVNLLLLATLGSCLLHALLEHRLRCLAPPALAFLYVAPIVVGGLLGMRHLHEIAPGFAMLGMLQFDSPGGYLREYVVKPLMLVVFAVLVGAAAARSRNPERFLAPALVSMALMSLLVLAFFAAAGVSLASLAGSEAREFLSPLGLHANDLGRLYVVAYAMLLFTFVNAEDASLRLALALAMALVVAALVLTFSRGAFAAFVVANVVFVLWRRSPRTWLAFALVVAVGLAALPASVYERLGAGLGQGLNAVTAGRWEGLWLPLFPEVLRSPVYGSGLNSILWSDAMRGSSGVTVLTVTHPHNAYLESLLDLGVAGTLLLLAYYAHVWRGFTALAADAALTPAMRGFYQGSAAALVCVMFANLTDGSLRPKAEQAFLWLAIGMMYGERYRAGREKP